MELSVGQTLGRASFAAALALAVPAAAQDTTAATGASSNAASGGVPSNGNVSGGRDPQPGQPEVRTR